MARYMLLSVGLAVCLPIAGIVMTASTAQATLIAEWQFASSNDLFVDSSGNGHTLEDGGTGVVWSSDHPTGVGAGSAYFNGSCLLATTGSLDLTPYNHIRVSWWHKVQTDTAAWIFEAGASSGGWMGAPGRICADVNDGIPVGGFAGVSTNDGGINMDRFPFTYDANNITWDKMEVEFNLTATNASDVVKVTKNGNVYGTDVANGFSLPTTFANVPLFIGGEYTGTEIKTLLTGNIACMTIESIPEPGTSILMATGMISLLAYAWRKRK